MPGPWTHAVRLHWRPNLNYYEQRTNVLRHLDRAEHLHAFNVRGELAGARVGQQELMYFRPTGAELYVVGPSTDLAPIRSALATVFDLLRPAECVVDFVAFHYLVEVDGTYDDVRRRSTEHVVDRVFDEAGASDYALLVDGYSDEIAAGYQVEFGIIGAGEAFARLSRTNGRMSSPDVDMSVLNQEIAQLQFPDVAVFSDWKWAPRIHLAEDQPPTALFDFWDGACVESGRMLSRVQVAAGAADHYPGTPTEGSTTTA